MIIFEDWGLTDYAVAWERQKEYQTRTVEIKLENRRRPTPVPTRDYLVFCEHPPVFTLGKNGNPNHVLRPPAFLEERGVSFFYIERGGDATFHGPGQIVGYPIFDLENYFTDLSRYLRTLEEAIILTMSEYGLQGERYPGYTGVWLEAGTDRARKIAAMGIKCSRWVTMHGFAFNVTTDLSYFDWIVPCGIKDKAVTSLERELGYPPAMDEVKAKLKTRLVDLFDAARRV